MYLHCFFPLSLPEFLFLELYFIKTDRRPSKSMADVENERSDSEGESEGNQVSEEGKDGEDDHVGTVSLRGVSIASLTIGSKQRLCLAQISSTLLKQFSYNEIHNRYRYRYDAVFK